MRPYANANCRKINTTDKIPNAANLDTLHLLFFLLLLLFLLWPPPMRLNEDLHDDEVMSPRLRMGAKPAIKHEEGMTTFVGLYLLLLCGLMRGHLNLSTRIGVVTLQAICWRHKRRPGSKSIMAHNIRLVLADM
jgi:hypothetical protein